MASKIQRLRSLLSAPNTIERIRNLLEIHFNYSFYGDKLSEDESVYTFDQFVDVLRRRSHGLAPHLDAHSEAYRAVESVRLNFAKIAGSRTLPLPAVINADLTLALLSYAVVKHQKPRLVLESGVGYGITSSLVLRAMEEEGTGELVSIDVPMLTDVSGVCSGLAVPEEFRQRWLLKLNISSRRFLRAFLQGRERVDFFISDSANVYTLQRFELSTVWPKLSSRGFILFNNIGKPFQKFLRQFPGADVWNIWQAENTGHVTTLIQKRL